VAVQKVLARRLARLLRKKVDKLTPIDLEAKA
jgi:hypothetical protein